MDTYAKGYLTAWAFESALAPDKSFNAGSCCGMA